MKNELRGEAAYYDTQAKRAYWVAGYAPREISGIIENAQAFADFLGIDVNAIRYEEIQRSMRFKYMALFEVDYPTCPPGFTECTNALHERIYA